MMKLAAALLILILGQSAFAQSARTRGQVPRPYEGNVEGFSGVMRYSGLTDFAVNRNPRAYTHNLMGALSYQLDENWSLEAVLGVRAETLAGQIEKGKEQTYDEVINPSSAFAVGYSGKFNYNNSFELSASGEPLWDQASRLEGYRGVIGVGGKWSIDFFRRRYILTNDFDLSELINTYRTASDGTANPDHFFTYKLSNVFRLFGQTRFSYTFGAKVTRYLDDFIGYSYQNSFGLSQKFGAFTAILSYDNGGFTDRGEISLWFIDEYRRIARLSLNYTF